jgi:hypothetical protein
MTAHETALPDKVWIIHPHLNPLPSRERKIREWVFHREREPIR